MARINKHNVISVFEHDKLKLGDNKDDTVFEDHHLEALQRYHGEKGTPYYSLIHHGVRFCEYVGVLNVGSLTIEVLPKADKSNDTDKWRRILIGMLKKVGTFTISATSHANLRLKSNHILDLYFDLFISEVEAIQHKGLIKKYRKAEGNLTALKGRLHFSKHINRNLVHQERFYVNHTIYDRQHPLNQVLYKTIKLVQQINNNSTLSSRIGTLLLSFPEIPDITVSDAWFERINYNRKTDHYRKAIEIARLLLLNYHPDLKHGRNHVLALMFDMNLLWEKFVYVSLRKYLEADAVLPQQKKPYWKLEGYRPVKLKPDIVLKRGESTYVIDTKWKMLDRPRPSDDDLRQMYAYLKYFQAEQAILCYPGFKSFIEGQFFHEEGLEEKYTCSILKIPVEANKQINYWQESISESILEKLT